MSKRAAKPKSENIPGFDRDLVELLQIPSPIEPAPLMTTDHLREMIPRLPLVNNQGYNLFLFGAINELEMMNPASPPRAMAVVDSPHPHDDPVLDSRRSATTAARPPRAGFWKSSLLKTANHSRSAAGALSWHRILPARIIP